MSNPYEWYYNHDRDRWIRSDGQTRESAIQEGQDALTRALAGRGVRPYGDEEFYICEARLVEFNDNIFDGYEVTQLFESQNEDLLAPEGNWSRDIKPEAEEELIDALNAAFAAWRAKHDPWVVFPFAATRNLERIEAAPEPESQQDGSV